MLTGHGLRRLRQLIPHQARIAATCRTPECSRRGLDVLPTLGSCPACGQQLSRTRAVTR